MEGASPAWLLLSFLQLEQGDGIWEEGIAQGCVLEDKAIGLGYRFAGIGTILIDSDTARSQMWQRDRWSQGIRLVLVKDHQQDIAILLLGSGAGDGFKLGTCRIN